VVCPLPCSDPTPLRSAAMLLFALPGTPFVYYGEELGLHGAASPDPSATQVVVTLNLASLGLTQAAVHERIFGSALPAVTLANAAAYPLAIAAKDASWILLQ
jgi:glycosidase